MNLRYKFFVGKFLFIIITIFSSKINASTIPDTIQTDLYTLATVSYNKNITSKPILPRRRLRNNYLYVTGVFNHHKQIQKSQTRYIIELLITITAILGLAIFVRIINKKNSSSLNNSEADEKYYENHPHFNNAIMILKDLSTKESRLIRLVRFFKAAAIEVRLMCTFGNQDHELQKRINAHKIETITKISSVLWTWMNYMYTSILKIGDLIKRSWYRLFNKTNPEDPIPGESKEVDNAKMLLEPLSSKENKVVPLSRRDFIVLIRKVMLMLYTGSLKIGDLIKISWYRLFNKAHPEDPITDEPEQ